MIDPPRPRATAESLPNRADFLRAAARGRKVAKPGMVVQILPTTPGGPLRIGFTASRKVGNAVHRNRARRRLRAMMRLALDERRLEGADIVLIARKDTAEIPFARLQADFATILDKAFSGAAR